ncbi:phosphatidylserine decarboxylase [Pontibacillus chungwhensis BH030062]|uniref:phosphatidylserine decarboxylase n=1 Tax=Pontibacillus chungwhensis BH030062 TaxID=1385513 RepID=A0A0A2VFD0_9BACI|nr:phosphatidylserine decarboxylase [Pontibacillus chungwhensis]KGP92320.1 phosphatidylserine decarboxylase [Pontibacillus chungwhensis BH030062]
MEKQLYRGLIRLFNNKVIGRFLQKASQTSVSKWFIPIYAKWFKINEEEIEKHRKEFTSLEDFFIRKLKADARLVNGNENEFVSPVDARIEQFGQVMDSCIKVKGLTYSIEDLLKDHDMSARYKDGLFVVLYLSPADYHRIHAPADAVVIKQYDLGGKSTPVNKLGLTLGRSPLSTNYRIVSELKQEDGTWLAIVKVGAMWINTIELTHPSSNVKKGEEVGYFSFGSTIVLLFEKDKVELHPALKRSSSIRVGEPLAVKKD